MKRLMSVGALVLLGAWTALANVPSAPSWLFAGYIHGKLWLIVNQDAAATDYDIQLKPATASDDSWQTIPADRWTRNVEWSGAEEACASFSVEMDFPGEIVARVRANNADGASEWSPVSSPIRATGASFGTAIGDAGKDSSHNLDCAFDGDLNTLYQPKSSYDPEPNFRWCGQAFDAPRRFRSARIVAETKLASRLRGISVEVADDAAFTENVRTVGQPLPDDIGGGAANSSFVYEIPFAEPVETRFIRINRPNKVCTIVECEFVDADLPERATPVVTAEFADATSIAVNWTNPDLLEAVSFKLERSVDGDAWTTVADNLPGTTLSYRDTRIDGAGSYSYRVTGISGAEYYAGQKKSATVTLSTAWGALPVLSFAGYVNGKLNLGVRLPTDDGATVKWQIQFRSECVQGWSDLGVSEGENYTWNTDKDYYPGKIFSLDVPTFLGPGYARIRAIGSDGSVLSSWVLTDALSRIFALSGTTIKDGMSTTARYDGRYAYDGNVNRLTTSAAKGSGWIGLDFGEQKKLRTIRAVARFGWPQSLNGLVVQTAADETFANPVDIGTFSDIVQTGVNEIVLPEAVTTRFVRLLRMSNFDNYLDCCGIEFGEEPENLPPPELADPVLVDGKTVSLSWTNPERLAAGTFRIERKEGDGAWQVLSDDLPGTTLSFADESVRSGRTYSYRVTGVSLRYLAEGTLAVSEVKSALLPKKGFVMIYR